MRPEREIPVKILMVNQNPLDQFLMSNSLEIGEVILHTADSTFQATRLIENSFYSLIIIDPTMPHSSGFELLKFLKDGEKTTHIPVVFFSTKEFNIAFMIEKYAAIDVLSLSCGVGSLKARLKSIIEMASYRKKILLEKNQIQEELNKYRTLIENLSPYYAFNYHNQEKKPITVVHENATVMFTGFANFERVAEKENTPDLVKKMEHYFQKFNEIIERYEMDKIYTNGDAVVSAGDMQVSNAQSAVKMIKSALEMNQFVHDLTGLDDAIEKYPWRFCCGISTGRVISDNLINPPFDIWGETVALAFNLKRIESAHEIIISESTKVLVKDTFELESLGYLQIDKSGEQEIFAVKGLKESHDSEWVDRISNQLYLP